MRRFVLALAFQLLALEACGGRLQSSASDGGAGVDATAPTVFACTPGDPPALLWVDSQDTPTYLRLATDGNRLYVLQQLVPAVWSVDVHGHDQVKLYNEPISDTRLPLFASQGRAFFNAFFPDAALVWADGAGGPLHTLVKLGVNAFDPSGAYAFGWSTPQGANGGGGAILRTSLSDGLFQSFAAIDSNDGPSGEIRVTARFVHVVVGMNSPTMRDRRINIADGSLHDEVPSGAFVAGPNAVCTPNLGAHAIVCLFDNAAQPTTFPAPDLGFLQYVDADWAYGATAANGWALSRFSLADGHEEVVATGVMSEAITSANHCVYALTLSVSGTGPGQLWRYSPP